MRYDLFNIARIRMYLYHVNPSSHRTYLTGRTRLSFTTRRSSLFFYMREHFCHTTYLTSRNWAVLRPVYRVFSFTCENIFVTQPVHRQDPVPFKNHLKVDLFARLSLPKKTCEYSRVRSTDRRSFGCGSAAIGLLPE